MSVAVDGEGARYRRASGLVLHWQESTLVGRTWNGRRSGLTPSIATLLHQLNDWTPVLDIRDVWVPGAPVAELVALLDHLCELGLVECASRPAPTHGWDLWSPEATFFHFSTKNAPFPRDPLAIDAELRERARENPPPPATKRCDGPRQALPAGGGAESLAELLAARRTWRRFLADPVPLVQLGTLLRLTFKVQRRAVVDGQGEVVLKSSPSGGARHAIEAYVLAWNVAGLPSGAYHYDAAADDLVSLHQGLDRATVEDMLANQGYFARAGAAIVMCPVFARAMWRYAHPRAFRSILIEAGHLGQTFCLAATALGLAPFTTMAFSERQLEALIGLDGIGECPIYVAGVGTRDESAQANPGAITSEEAG